MKLRSSQISGLTVTSLHETSQNKIAISNGKLLSGQLVADASDMTHFVYCRECDVVFTEIVTTRLNLTHKRLNVSHGVLTGSTDVYGTLCIVVVQVVQNGINPIASEVIFRE